MTGATPSNELSEIIIPKNIESLVEKYKDKPKELVKLIYDEADTDKINKPKFAGAAIWTEDSGWVSTKTPVAEHVKKNEKKVYKPPAKVAKEKLHVEAGITRHHQTAVILECANVPHKDTYFERLNKIASSFNHDQTCKSEVYVLCGNRLMKWFHKFYFAGLEFTSPSPAIVKQASDWAAKMDYTVVMFALVPGREVE